MFQSDSNVIGDGMQFGKTVSTDTDQVDSPLFFDLHQILFKLRKFKKGNVVAGQSHISGYGLAPIACSDYGNIHGVSPCLLKNFISIHKPPASIRFAPIKHVLAVMLNLLKSPSAKAGWLMNWVKDNMVASIGLLIPTSPFLIWNNILLSSQFLLWVSALL
jgi:hypothetical protein